MVAKMVTTALLHPVHRPPTSFLSYLNPYHHRLRCLSSSPATRYPLYYELIVSRPPPSRLSPRNHPPAAEPIPPNTPFENWADRKISDSDMDKPMRKYYSKRRKRMFGSDSDDGRDGGGGRGEKFIELKPEVVELPTYHAREEELYFYDAFALPWEKDKHYRMVYQLEKKYFPDQCLDKAFVNTSGKGKEVKDDVDKRLVFFDEEEEKVDWDESVEQKKKKGGSGEVGVTEKKVGEFFKCLKTVPGDGQVRRSHGEPFLASKRTGLPPRWDGPFGTVVLVNKPKGSFFLVHHYRFFSYHFVFF